MSSCENSARECGLLEDTSFRCYVNRIDHGPNFCVSIGQFKSLRGACDTYALGS